MVKKSKNEGLIEDETYQSLLKQLETIHLKLNIYIKNIGK